MRVLRFLPSGVYGGPHNEMAELNDAFREVGVTQIAILPAEAGDAAGRLTRSGIDVRVAATWRPRRTRSLRFWLAAPFQAARDIWKVKALVEAERADLVVCSGGAVQIAVAARLGGARVVWVVADISLPAVARTLMMPILFFLSDAVLAGGRTILDHYPCARLIRRRAVQYFPPVDLGRFYVRSRISAGDELAIGTVSHLTPDKGIDVLLAAASLIAPRVNTRFLIVASEHATHRQYANLVRDFVGREAESIRISLRPPTSAVEDFLPRLDIFVCPSRREGVSTAVIEAQACGIPVVACDVGATAELVDHGETGFLVRPEDPRALAEAVVRLACDPELRRRQGKAAAARARRIFGIEATTRAFLCAFETATARS
jgi:glycosyltransferase involved in cell wall biosynthesis